MSPTSSSSDPALSPADAESRYEANQRLISYGATVGAVALAGQHVFSEAHLHGWPSIAVTLTSVLGWIVFGVGLFRNRQLGRTAEGRAFLRQVLADERLHAIRYQAFTYGFAAMLGVQVLLLLLWTLFGHTDTDLLTIPVTASTTIAAGVTGTVLRYQIMTSR